MPKKLNPATGLIEEVPGDPTDMGGGNPARGGQTFAPGATATPPAGPPADATGGANPTQRQPVSQGYQPKGRTAPTPWAGATTTVPPPPPPIPGMASGPNFGAALAGLQTPQKGPTYQSSVNIAPAQRGPQYQTAQGAFQGEELLPDLNDFSRDWMANFNPLNSGYGATAREGANANLRKLEQDQTKGLEEFMASRGLVGSSVEADGRIANAESIRRTALDEEARIMELIANMELMGRQGAGQFGLGVGEFGRATGADRRDEGRFSWEADRTTGRDFEDDTRFRAGFEEDQNRFGFESEYRAGRDLVGDQFDRAQIGLDAAGMEDDSILNRYLADLEAKRMAETGIMDRAQLGLDRDDLSQRSWRDNANVTRDYDLMDQDDSQFAENDRFRRDEFGEEQRQYDGDSAFRDRELAAKTRAQEDALLAEILDGGIGEITPEIAAWIEEKFGVKLPVSKDEEEKDAEPTEYTTSGVYKSKPKGPPKGKSGKDGRWNNPNGMGWVWTDDKQDWWNPGDWLD